MTTADQRGAKENRTDPLGRLLAEVKSGPRSCWARLWFGLGVLSLLALFGWIGGLTLIATGAVFGIATAMLVAVSRGDRGSLQLYERRIRICRLNDRDLRFDQVRQCSFQRTPARTVITIWTTSADPPLSIRLDRLGGQSSDQLQLIEEALARWIATSLLRDLVQTGSVYWTPDIVVRLYGLSIRREGIWETIGYDEVGEVLIDDQQVTILPCRSGRPLFCLDRHAANALAGWLLLENVRQVVREVRRDRGQHASELRQTALSPDSPVQLTSPGEPAETSLDRIEQVHRLETSPVVEPG